MKQSLGRLERQLFAYAQMRGLRTLRTGDLTKALEISPIQERKLFTRLSTAGMIAKVYRGLYLIPPKLPLGGKWTPDEFLALNTLLTEKKGRYQICGPSAFNRYGFTEQIPTRITAYNNRVSATRVIGSVTLELIKVSEDRIGEVEEVKTPQGETGFYSSRTRSLLDAVYDWSRFNTLPRAYEWIEKEIQSKRVSVDAFIGTTLTYGDVGTIRRIGFFLQKLDVKRSLLTKLKKTLRPTTAFIPFNPRGEKRGRVNYEWGILDNEER